MIPFLPAMVHARTFRPSDLGSTKLRFWIRPESLMWTTSGGTTVAVATDPIGKVFDESGNGLDVTQPTSGKRPTRRTNGGIALSGDQWLVGVALGAWAADYCVGVVCKSTSSSSYERITEVDYSVGHAITMLNDASGQSKAAVADSGAPYGLINTTSLGSSIRTLFDSRVGTTHAYSVDGGTAVTATVTGAALNNGAFYLAALPSAPGTPYSMVGDLHEVFVVASPTADDLANLKAYLAARVASGVYS